jgi:hypothetical protein
MEYYFLKENIGAGYKSRGIGSSGLDQLAGYVFVGVGVGYFTSKGQVMDADGNMTDEWVNLQDLNTEGQGLPGAPADYSPITMVIPIGVGLKYSLTPQMPLGAEYGFRFTTTDYLDDVSSRNYYDNDAIRAQYGDLSAEMADQRLGDARGTDGVRGGPDVNDVYMSGFVYLTYRFRTVYRGRSRF